MLLPYDLSHLDEPRARLGEPAHGAAGVERQRAREGRIRLAQGGLEDDLFELFRRLEHVVLGDMQNAP